MFYFVINNKLEQFKLHFLKFINDYGYYILITYSRKEVKKMRVDFRVKICRLHELMDRHEEYCQKIGLQKNMRRKESYQVEKANLKK